MSKFSEIPNFATGLETMDDITELQEDISKLVERTNKWQMNFNVDKCSVMHSGQNNTQGNYNMFADDRSTA